MKIGVNSKTANAGCWSARSTVNFHFKFLANRVARQFQNSSTRQIQNWIAPMRNASPAPSKVCANTTRGIRQPVSTVCWGLPVCSAAPAVFEPRCADAVAKVRGWLGGRRLACRLEVHAWRRGRVVYATACKAVYPGSIPGAASKPLTGILPGQGLFSLYRPDRSIPLGTRRNRHFGNIVFPQCSHESGQAGLRLHRSRSAPAATE